jgi:hypothetical protein
MREGRNGFVMDAEQALHAAARLGLLLQFE